ncbi:MAG: hypothetical protein NW200_11775, partial [Hyphomonadaceae bacterium]|nr:hypothetical protein [Hyphomonadaceae bacterium]
SNLSQAIAALAVIASLIYAALQFRIYAQAAREVRYSTTIADLQEFRKILATDADCARIYRDGLEDMNKLDAVEQWRFGALIQHVLTNFQYGLKFSDALDVEHLKLSVAATMQRPGARQWWVKGRMTIGPETRALVDALLASDAPRFDGFKAKGP